MMENPGMSFVTHLQCMADFSLKMTRSQASSTGCVRHLLLFTDRQRKMFHSDRILQQPIPQNRKLPWQQIRRTLFNLQMVQDTFTEDRYLNRLCQYITPHIANSYDAKGEVD